MRGGKREGAGRRRKLDFLERISIGAKCENRFRQIWNDASEKAWSNRPGAEEVRTLQEENVAELLSLSHAERAG